MVSRYGLPQQMRRADVGTDMNNNEVLRRLAVDGWCVLQGVIPGDEVDGIRQAVLTEEARQREEQEAMLAKVRAQGHRISVAGVGNVSGLISAVPEVAPHLAEERILAAAEALVGPYFRLSTLGGLVNWPGTERGYWHSDWPFNQTVASHIPAPYPDAVIHLSSIFMLSRFSAENGGTLIVPGSHRLPDNPSGENGVDRDAPHPKEINVTGGPGDVFLYDSRLWHSVAENNSDQPRVAMTVRYAPWWLNLNVQREGHPDHRRIVVETNGKDSVNPPISVEVFDSLPAKSKPLFAHWVEG